MSLLKGQSNSINLQDRDFVILRGLFECRVMTTAHAMSLYFDNKRAAANSRLQKLKSCGFIGERPRRAFEPSVLFLTRKGLMLLKEQGILAQYPQFNLSALERRARVSDLTIRHELEVVDVKAAFHSAIKSTEGFSIAEFSTWPLLHQFEAFRSGYGGAEVLIRPDGFIRIHETGADGGVFERVFFLEVDRSTEAQDILTTRAGSYLDYYKSGGFAVRSGGKRDQYKEYPFRVLFVFKTAERRNNIAERLLQNTPPILTQAMLSTFDEVTTNPLGLVWTCPRDYREAIKGTAFDTEGKPRMWGYRRQTEREVFMEKNIQKRRILSEDIEA